VPLPGEDTGELAESGVVRARLAPTRVQGIGVLRDDGDLHLVPPGWRIFVTVSCQGDGK
jgi:hypothetical protein